jgi:hypothetical protein
MHRPDARAEERKREEDRKREEEARKRKVVVQPQPGRGFEQPGRGYEQPGRSYGQPGRPFGQSRPYVAPSRPVFEERFRERSRVAEGLRLQERERFERERFGRRDEFFHLHPFVQLGWRWEWHGGACGAYIGAVWTPYGVEYCRAALPMRYYWFGGVCREYTPAGVFIATAEFGYCGSDETYMTFNWNGTSCWEYDIFGRPILALDNSFCISQYGTHYGWVNGACAELANGSDIFIRYMVNSFGYQDATPCMYGTLDKVIGKGSSSPDALALLEETQTAKQSPALLGDDLNATPATQSSALSIQ